MRAKNRKVRQITDMLEILLSPKTADRLFVFFDDAPLPCDEEIYDIVQEHAKALEQVHVQGGEMSPPQQRVVELADAKVHSVIRRYGGIDEFRSVFRCYSRNEKTKEKARILKGFSYLGGIEIATTKDIANKIAHTSIRQMYRLKDEALKQIAQELINRQREKRGGKR